MCVVVTGQEGGVQVKGSCVSGKEDDNSLALCCRHADEGCWQKTGHSGDQEALVRPE